MFCFIFKIFACGASIVHPKLQMPSNLPLLALNHAPFQNEQLLPWKEHSFFLQLYFLLVHFLHLYFFLLYFFQKILGYLVDPFYHLIVCFSWWSVLTAHVTEKRCSILKFSWTHVTPVNWFGFRLRLGHGWWGGFLFFLRGKKSVSFTTFPFILWISLFPVLLDIDHEYGTAILKSMPNAPFLPVEPIAFDIGGHT